MKQVKKKLIVVTLALVMLITTLGGCRQSERVSYNISQEADNFNVIRRLVVINGRTDKVVFELIGAFSFEIDETGGIKRIVAVVEVGDNEYKKHSVGLPDEAFWDVEDISGANVNKYWYEVNFLPEMLAPAVIVSED